MRRSCWSGEPREDASDCIAWHRRRLLVDTRQKMRMQTDICDSFLALLLGPTFLTQPLPRRHLLVEQHDRLRHAPPDPAARPEADRNVFQSVDVTIFDALEDCDDPARLFGRVGRACVESRHAELRHCRLRHRGDRMAVAVHSSQAIDDLRDVLTGCAEVLDPVFGAEKVRDELQTAKVEDRVEGAAAGEGRELELQPFDGSVGVVSGLLGICRTRKSARGPTRGERRRTEGEVLRSVD